jgi:hypothetical protein
LPVQSKSKKADRTHHQLKKDALKPTAGKPQSVSSAASAYEFGMICWNFLPQGIVRDPESTGFTCHCDVFSFCSLSYVAKMKMTCAGY